MKKCRYCENQIPHYTDYLKYEGEFICNNCYEEETVTNFYIGGEYCGNRDDGYEKIYSWENESS